MGFEIAKGTEKPVTETDPRNGMESVRKLANVRLCEDNLKKLLETGRESVNFEEDARDMLYEMLTQRSEFVAGTSAKGVDADTLMENFAPQETWYASAREMLEKDVDASEGEFTRGGNSDWFGINVRPESGRREGISVKAYTTISTSDYTSVGKVMELAQNLRELAIRIDDAMQVKIPATLREFLRRNDSIVVHFKKKENGPAVLEIVDEWMRSNGIRQEAREMGRTRIAADSNNSSFSDLVARNIAGWLRDNLGKYDDALLASEAVRHAIEQSRKSPV